MKKDKYFYSLIGLFIVVVVINVVLSIMILDAYKGLETARFVASSRFSMYNTICLVTNILFIVYSLGYFIFRKK